MANHVCPFWVGYILLNPLRRLVENPYKMLGPLIQEEMTILEPGCGMGYFTLPMAKMVGEKGTVIAADIQPNMLTALKSRAEKAGLADRIKFHPALPDKLGLTGAAGTVDLAVAIHMVHEIDLPGDFFYEVSGLLKMNGKMFIVEPKGHVSEKQFRQTISLALNSGFEEIRMPIKIRGWHVLLKKRKM